jgi:hypothetical protein
VQPVVKKNQINLAQNFEPEKRRKTCRFSRISKPMSRSNLDYGYKEFEKDRGQSVGVTKVNRMR